MVQFTDHFWGEKFLGFDVLYHNMKYGQKSCNDFIEFIKERMLVEENYSKQLNKLSRQVSAYPLLGSFSPYWNVLRQSTEKDSSLHQQTVVKLQDILKDIQKYMEEQSKKHKTMKDAEQETSNVVQAIQTLSVTLQKAKEAYLSRSQELDKLRKENGGPRDIERADTRVKKATEDYRGQIEKYATMRLDFERKMTNSSQHFQALEEQHLQQMLEFANAYSRTLEYNQQTFGEICMDLRHQTAELSVERLLQMFVESKSTGTDRPIAVEFEESQPPLHAPSPPFSHLLSFDGDENVSVSTSAVVTPSTVEETGKERKREGILRKPAPSIPPLSQVNSMDGGVNGHGDHGPSEKHNDHQTKEKKSFMDSRHKFPSLKNLFTAKSSDVSEPRSCPQRNSLIALDDLNFTKKLRPDLTRATLRGSKWFFRSKKDPTEKEKDNKKDTKKKDKKKTSKEVSRETTSTPTIAEDVKSESSFGSQPYDQSNASMQPQLDADGFIIRPLDNSAESKKRSDSYEQYRAASSSDSESEDESRKKIHVVIKPPTIQANHTGPSGDELRAQARNLTLGPGLGFSYTGGKRATARMQEVMQRSSSMSSDMMTSKLNAFSFDPFNQSPQSSATDSSVSTPSQNFAIPPQKTGGSITSNPWDSTLDLSLLSQTAPQFPAPPIPTGPSIPQRSHPHSGSFSSSSTAEVPVAVAFLEKVSATFVGADESRCRMRIDGDLILTFPSSVLQTLLANPNHPALSFHLTQTNLLENILPNKHLVSQETQIDDGRITYTFNMPNLTNQLKKQSEAKAVPQPYQNIPVMKYHVMASAGAQHAPIHLVCYWKHEERCTDMRLDYRRNLTCPPLRGFQLALAVPPEVEVTSVTSMPTGDFSPHEHCAKWNILHPSTEMANVKARFEHPPASRGRVAGPVTCSFQADGMLLSKVVFDLACEGYKVSMVKMRVSSAKYVCEAE